MTKPSEIGIILHNTNQEHFKVYNGDRIAQLVLQEVPVIDWKVVDSLEETARGAGRYGSTGIK